MAVVRVSAAIVHTSVIVAADTDYAAMPERGQVWVGTTTPGSSNLCITGDAAALIALADALHRCATRMLAADGAA